MHIGSVKEQISCALRAPLWLLQSFYCVDIYHLVILCKLDRNLSSIPPQYSLDSLACGFPVVAGEPKQMLLDEQHFPNWRFSFH